MTDPITPGTLRANLEELRAAGSPMTMSDAVGVIVPLCVELAQRHEGGESVFVHPSAIVIDDAGDAQFHPELGASPPVHPHDLACMAPEERSGAAPDARESVYAVGAMLYEMLTLELVGPGMRRPTEVNPSLPPAFEAILAKALVADPAHRPDDLRALAQAIHHLAPTGSLAPPPADESHLDHGDDFEVDVSLSMLPPVSAPPASSPYEVAVQDNQPKISGVDAATNELATLKARLESDPRPRYVVVKDGMDHGPFSAVELLQQIANHTFEEHDYIRDSLLNDERAIKDWEEFAPFAEHAKRHRVIAAEKVALEASVEEEKKSTTRKGLVGGAVVVAFLGLAAAWFVVQRGSRSDDVLVQGDLVTSVDMDGGLKVPKKKRGGKGRRVVGTSGGIPILAGGMSCEAAQAAYVEEIKMGQKVAADITRAQYGAVLNSGSYLNGCGVPSSMGVNVCVAVQNGRAVGVTIRTEPHNPGVASCISRKVRGLSFPSHPKLDVTRTRFAPQ